LEHLAFAPEAGYHERMTASVYFDNNATTAVAPEVLEAMLPFLREHYGNPSSPHEFARKPAMAVAKAREQVAAACGVAPASVVFTSGGTEGNAMAIHAALAARPTRKKIIFSAVEHAAVWGWRKRLASQGYTIRVAGVNRDGALNLDEFKSLLSEKTALVCLMLANNETGIVYPVEQVAALAHEAGALVHTDAVQATGKIPVDFSRLGVDYATIGGHKFHAVKGVGALYVRDAKNFSPLTLGGEQESGLRPGTEAVPSIVSLGAAAELAMRPVAGMAECRDDFETWLEATFPGVIIAGKSQLRLPNTTFALFPGIETEPLLALLDMHGVACSSGSACASGAHEPSHVLAAMNLAAEHAAVIRISASRYTTNDDYARLRDALCLAVGKLR
jgi:cysteine desulfurase